MRNQTGMTMTDIRSIQSCAADLRSRIVDAGLTLDDARKGIRIHTHALSSSLASAGAKDFGGLVVVDFDREILEHAMLIVF